MEARPEGMKREKIPVPEDIAREVFTVTEHDRLILEQAVSLIHEQAPGLIDWAKNNRLVKLSCAAKDKLPLEAKTIERILPHGAGGAYRPQVKDILLDASVLAMLKTRPDPDEHPNQVWTPDIITVAQAGGEESFYARLLTHELAHHYHYREMERLKDGERNHVYRYYFDIGYSALKAGRCVSKYAQTHPLEWFAETLSAYIWMPESLEGYDLISYQAMARTGLGKREALELAA
jgi:hypothetical protein